MARIRRLSSGQSDFDAQLKALLSFEAAQDAEVEQVVAAILADVRAVEIGFQNDAFFETRVNHQRQCHFTQFAAYITRIG